MNRVLRECKEYCYKTYLSLAKSNFNKCRTEVAFDDREEVNYGQQAILLSGIGNPRPFVREAEVRFNVVDKMLFGDHHHFTTADMRRLYEKLKHNPRAVIIMTEKDAVRLRRSKLPEPLMRAMYFMPIHIDFVEGPDTDLHGNIIAEIKYESKRGAKGK